MDFGSTTLSSSGGAEIFVAKVSSSGSWEWAVKAGGSLWDGGASIAVDLNGNVFVTGKFESTASFGSTTLTSADGESSRDIFVAKLSNSGTWLWAVRAGGPSGDYGVGIAVDNTGNAFVTGDFKATANFGSTTLSSSGDADIFVAKLSGSGSWIWATKAGGTSNDYGAEIVVDSNGNPLVTGSFESTATFGSSSVTSEGYSDIFISKLVLKYGQGNWHSVRPR
ncbi:MAG: hypothetical protein CXX81_02760 [Methanobacteriota archaeon]|nr:MAG: hypothetical protein CXX81_02760 [Euryarchaeota archaeon]